MSARFSCVPLCVGACGHACVRACVCMDACTFARPPTCSTPQTNPFFCGCASIVSHGSIKVEPPLPTNQACVPSRPCEVLSSQGGVAGSAEETAFPFLMRPPPTTKPTQLCACMRVSMRRPTSNVHLPISGLLTSSGCSSGHPKPTQPNPGSFG